MTKQMAQNIGGSGLTYSHMKCVFIRDGGDDLKQLLSSKSSGRVRVTNRQDILNAIVTHFETNK